MNEFENLYNVEMNSNKKNWKVPVICIAKYEG